MRRLPFALALAAATSALAPASHANTRDEWDFVVRLDGQRVGTHRFTLSKQPGGQITVTSEAHFAVRVLGWTAYRYDHRSRESWNGPCLASIDATTDDNGSATHVRGARAGDRLDVQVTHGKDPDSAKPDLELGGCVMSFAYWNPALRFQRHLLDPGTGRWIDVQITPLRAASGWRITGLANAIDVLWDGDDWVGLDTTVGDRRHLSYRLR